jgi:hypothetical protein
MSRARPPACGQAIGGGGRDGMPGKAERFPPPPIDFAWLFQIACNFPTSVSRWHTHFQLRCFAPKHTIRANSPGHETPAEQGQLQLCYAICPNVFVGIGPGEDLGTPIIAPCVVPTSSWWSKRQWTAFEHWRDRRNRLAAASSGGCPSGCRGGQHRSARKASQAPGDNDRRIAKPLIRRRQHRPVCRGLDCPMSAGEELACGSTEADGRCRPPRNNARTSSRA